MQRGVQAVRSLSDHQSFVVAAAAVSVQGFVGGDHRTPRATDTLDKIDFTYLGRVARAQLAGHRGRRELNCRKLSTPAGHAPRSPDTRPAARVGVIRTES
jgi:hypothetical protein